MGEKNIGIQALFNGDLQNIADFQDRQDWIVISAEEIEYIEVARPAPPEATDNHDPVLNLLGSEQALHDDTKPYRHIWDEA